MRVSEGGTSKPDRFANLDGLRGLAALAVMLAHLCAIAMINVRSGGTATDQTLGAFYAYAHEYVNFGRVGVILFFLISGYLVPFSLSGPNAVRDFLISRFFRLYPLFWFSLAIASVLRFLMDEPLSAGLILANVTMIADVLGSTRLLDVYWTLAIEFGFYALVLVLYLCLGPMRFWIAALSSAAFLGASLAISLAQIFGTNLPLGDKSILFGVMFLGTALRLTRTGSRRHILVLTGLTALFAIVVWSRAYVHGVLLIYGQPNEFIGFGSYIGSDLLALALFLVGLSVTGSPPVLVRLGRISYSLYILHPLVMNASDWLGFSRPLASTGLYVPVLAAMSLGLSALSYRWIEAPAIAMGRTVRRRLRQTSGPARETAAPPAVHHRRWSALLRKDSQLRGVR